MEIYPTPFMNVNKILVDGMQTTIIEISGQVYNK